MSKTTRPSSISELAALTLKEVQWNPEKGFKHWVLVADKAGSTGRKCLAERDYERAFVEYGKASIIVLKKLPTHPDYERYLTTEQRRNMRLNGQDILQSLIRIKPIITKRYEQWCARTTSTNPDCTDEEKEDVTAKLPVRARRDATASGVLDGTGKTFAETRVADDPGSRGLASGSIIRKYDLEDTLVLLSRVLDMRTNSDDEDIQSSTCSVQFMANATGPEAAFLVELLDKTLDSAESQGPFRRLCFRVLKTLCIKNQIFPQSFFLPSAALQRSRQWPQAAGGFANVYMGTYEGRQVAIKVVRAAEIPEMNTAHAQILKDICKEAIVWKYLRHPNVTPFYGIDTTMFPVSFVCQWMPHDTVNAYLCERPAANRIKLLSDVAEGVNYLHSMDCLHGDLKGSNILISSKHEACLSDFGLATLRRGDSSANVAATSMTSGTFRWTAPELLDPEKFGFERAIPTPESDIYSFSMVMLEIFTGKFPFHNLSTDASVIVRVLQGVRPLRPLQATPLGLSDKLWSLMEQCWDADRQKRPPATVVLQLLRDTAQNPLAEPETWPLDLKSGL